MICSGLTAHLLRVAATSRLCSQRFTVKFWLPQMLPNFGYGCQIMPTDVKKQGLPQMSANRPNIGSTGKEQKKRLRNPCNPWRILTVLLYMVLHGSHQYTPFMLAIPAPWILYGLLQAFKKIRQNWTPHHPKKNTGNTETATMRPFGSCCKGQFWVDLQCEAPVRYLSWGPHNSNH